MEKINVAELLKDCPKGMELDCSVYNDVTFERFDVEQNRCYFKAGPADTFWTTCYGAVNGSPFGKCVIFPKGKTTWEGFQRPFEDGDIVFTHANCLKVGLGNTWISIFQEKRNGGVATYVDYAEDGSDFYADEDKGLLCMNEDIMRQRLATEEEKEKLFKAIKDNGYKWNEETKTLEKLPKFKIGDVVQDKDTYKVKITEINIEDECFGYESLIAKGIGSISFCEQDHWELVPDKFDVNTLKTFENKVLIRDHSSFDLLPHKEENMEETIKIDIPKGYEFFGIDDDNKVVLTKKQFQYPKTYEECEGTTIIGYNKYLLERFQQLLICRDAYWKIAGEEMGLDEPWNQDYNDRCFIIANNDGIIHTYEYHGSNNVILAFPTKEMRDAFYENFKDLIEKCKEFL